MVARNYFHIAKVIVEITDKYVHNWYHVKIGRYHVKIDFKPSNNHNFEDVLPEDFKEAMNSHTSTNSNKTND